jgi:hypothetical protein
VLFARVRGLAVWTDCAVIRICYEDFSAGTHDGAGLHGRTERGARGVTIYLLPGLSAGERGAVLRRLRQEASRSLGPPLPGPQFAVALGLDWVRTTARTAKAVVRLHPAVTVLPSVFVVALLALFVAASAEGASGLEKTRAGLAGNVAARSGKALRPGTVRLDLARIAGVSVVVGVRARTNGEGIALVEHPHARLATGQCRYGKVSGRTSTWSICPQATTGLVPRPHAGQPARCPALYAVPPYTTHLPGPRDLAR